MTMPFIVIEGVDGVGKATQAALLASALEARGIPCFTTAFPQYEKNKFGRHLAHWLAGEYGNFVDMAPRDASLLYAADQFESADDIRAALADGKVVVSDRYSGSNMIHQGGKIPEGGKRDAYLAWLRNYTFVVLRNPQPTLNLYLDATVQISLRYLAQKRASKGKVLADGEQDQVESDLRYLTQSHEMGRWLAAREPDWLRIDCAADQETLRSREDIHADIMRAIEPFLA